MFIHDIDDETVKDDESVEDHENDSETSLPKSKEGGSFTFFSHKYNTISFTK